MRMTLIFAAVFRLCTAATGLSLWALASHAQSCRVEMPIRVELQREEFTMADLFPADTCPAIVRAAAQVRLGKLPREGVARILDGADLRDRFWSTSRIHPDKIPVHALNIPQRITVTRSGISASCQELATRVLPTYQSQANIIQAQCGLAADIRSGAHFELTKRTWDPALRSWELTARCMEPKDCLPFLIRVADHPEDEPASLINTSFPENVERTATLYRGNKTEVIWQQNGMRLRLPGIALDSGRTGDKVRVHLKSGAIISGIVDRSGSVSWSQ